MMRITNVRGRRVSSLLCVSECKNVVKAILIRSVLVFLLVAPSACVGITGWPPDQVTIDPCNPTSSDIVTITLSGTWDNSCVPNDVNVSTDGNDIYFDVINKYPPGSMCPTVQTPWSQTQSVGPLLAGSFEVMARLIWDSNAPTPYVPVASFDVRPQVETKIFTDDTIIEADDQTYDGNDIVVGGCTLTVDGSHDFNSMLILSGGILTHSAANPSFDLTITGDMTVDAGGSVNVDGKGHPGGQGPGRGENGHHSAGAGYGGTGGNGSMSTVGGISYGSLTNPLDMGSGGGNAYGGAKGGPGGGLIRLTVNGALMVDGSLAANGSNGISGGYCSGGALVAVSI